MSKSNNVCRNILDTQSVIKNQIASLLVEELSTESEDTRQLINKVSKCIDDQTNSLVNRVLDEFNK
jgi:hypothetical protein